MKAIKTKCISATDIKPVRIKATDEDGNSIIRSWGYYLEQEVDESSYDAGIHRNAAQALCDKMGWKGEFVTGALKDCYVHVFV